MTTQTAQPAELKPPTDFSFTRFHVDLSTSTVRYEKLMAEDYEDALGGIARATKLLGPMRIEDPYAPDAPLVMNLGLLTGTRVMTGLRTFFHGYSPLKSSLSGMPGLMWSAGSGHFGTKLRGLGIDEVVFTGRAPQPTLLRLSVADDPDGPMGPVRFEFLDATDLSGRLINDRIQDLHVRYPDAHFAVIGPAGEHPESVRYAAIALSTDNQLKSGDAKARFCGRGGFGGVAGSKNLYAIAADGPNPGVSGRGLKEVNREINLGEGSARYRDLPHDRGGTWRVAKMMQEAASLPEFNFAPTGSEKAIPLLRPSVEAGPYVVKAESCYLCGIKCHKNVYDETSDGEAGTYRAKVDYEPLALLSSNLGVYDADQAFDLIELGDEYGMDSISLGVSIGYAMEYNKRHPETPIAAGISYGDFDAITAMIRRIGIGELAEVGQGSMRLAAATDEPGYAMHSKGVEYPAYQPQTNPGYPWALAGGHMSMRTYLLLIVERETDTQFWIDAITGRGLMVLLDDITGMCKFSLVPPEVEAEALRIAAGLDVDGAELEAVVHRTFLRGYAAERLQGFTLDDYAMPAETHEPSPGMTLPYFNTPEFFVDLRDKVSAIFDERATAAGFLP